MTYEFKGDNKALVSSITALLALDAKGALTPHGIGGMARDLLETCAARLPAEQHQGDLISGAVILAGKRHDSIDTEELLARIAQAARAEHQGKPVAWFTDDHLSDKSATTWDIETAERWRDKGWPVSPLYTHADPGEVERLRKLSVTNIMLDITPGEDGMGHEVYAKSVDDVEQKLSAMGERLEHLDIWHGGFRELLRKIRPHLLSQESITAEIDAALSASAEPSTPVEIDEPTDMATWKRRAIEAESKLRTFDPQVIELGERAMQTLLVEPKPKELVLTKCKLCDQLQADLTERDEQNDQVRQLLQHMVSDYRSVVQAGYDRITALGSDCDSVAKMLDDNPNYQKALALLLPDLESRPEERGTPETEPCSGCGTPGWTGACNKCVPY